MGKWKKSRRWGQPKGQGEPMMVKVPVLLLLINGFTCISLRGTDILVVTLISTLLAMVGMVIAWRARKIIRRKGGRVRGETMATIGYWGNLVVFVMAGLLFSYAVAMGVLRGDLL
ncbi:MAG: hypothetical protein AB3N33_08480 [Puniceicoccaceae bacterium]